MLKPAKPYPDFPLCAHPNGQWAKKIKGKIHYFGAWSNPGGALEKYRAFIGEHPPLSAKKNNPASG
jgi:hypothetical protein